jgi:hypothetical protein
VLTQPDQQTNGKTALGGGLRRISRSAQQCAEHIGIEGGGVALGGLLRHRAGLAFRTGVVDGRIQAAEARDGLIDQIADLIVVLNVGLDERGVSAEAAKLGRKLLAGVLVAAANDQSGAFLRESDGGRAADLQGMGRAWS